MMTIVRIAAYRLFFSAGIFIASQCAYATIPASIPRAEIFREIIPVLKTQYVDSDKIVPKKMLASVMKQLSIFVAPLMYDLKTNADALKISIGKETFTRRIPTDFNSVRLQYLLEDISFFVKKNSPEIDLEAVDIIMIKALVSTLDPHTQYFGAKNFALFMRETRGSYQGVGIVFSLKNERVVIEKVITGSPAQKTGLKMGDVIVKVNLKPIDGLDLNEVTELFLGKKNSPLDILIERKKGSRTHTMSFHLTQEKIEISSIESSQLSGVAGRIGYVKIKGFQANTYRDLNTALDNMSIDLKDFKGIILDLRNNPGGLLEQSIRVSNKFLTGGMIVHVATVNNEIKQRYKATPYNTIEKIPLVVLINENSASAAEIVAAALKQNHRAVIIGKKSFGKGSVQDLFEFSDEGALKITNSKYLTPNEISIQSRGVQPHISIDHILIEDHKFFASKIQQYLSESSLENNFSEWADEPDRSEFSFDYDKSYGANNRNQDELKSLFPQDYELHFAKRLLMDYSGKHTVKAFKNYVLGESAIEKKQQNKEIKKKMWRRNVQWKMKKNESKQFKLTLGTSQKNSTAKRVLYQSGESFQIYADIENIGGTDSSPLWLVISGRNLPFRQKHFAIGNLAPTRHKKISVPVMLNAGVAPLPIRYKAILYDAAGTKLIETKDNILIANVTPHPKFSIQFNTTPVIEGKSERPKTSAVKKITVSAKVKKLSKFAAEDNFFTLKKNGGNRVRLKKIKSVVGSGSKTDLLYLYELEWTRPPAGDYINLAFSTKDSNFMGYPIINNVRIPYKQPSYSMENGPPSVVIINDGGNGGVIVNKTDYALRFEVSDDKEWREIVVFYNDHKIFFDRNQTGRGKTVVELDSLPLRLNDFNTFKIMAKDDQSLSTIREYTILQHSY